MTDNNLPPVMYGIWRPRKGWYGVADKKGEWHTYSDLHSEVAQELAQRLGHGAQVKFIDESIERAEKDLLASEAEQWNYRLLDWIKKVNLWKPKK